MAADYPSRVDIVPWGSWNAAAVPGPERWNGGWLDLGIMRLGGPAVWARWDLALKAGTWALTLLGFTGSDRGISTVKLGTTTLAALDWYTAGAPVPNVVKTVAGFTVGASGMHALEISRPTMNPAAVTGVVDLHHLTLQRTGS